MAQTAPERRSFPRIQIESPMQYRQVESHDFLPGHIENISANGALIWIEQEYPLDSELIVRIEADGPDEDTTDLVATLLYQLTDKENARHGYGCSTVIA